MNVKMLILHLFLHQTSYYRLKKEIFNKDHLTDIIAFRLNNYSEKFIEGEIYISLQRVKENSSQFNQPYQKRNIKISNTWLFTSDGI